MHKTPPIDESAIQVDLDQRNQIVEKIRESLINEESNRKMMSS